MRTIRLLSVGVAVGGIMALAQPALAREPIGPCDAHWDELAPRHESKSPPDYQAFLNDWQALKTECSHSSRYWARLGLIYFYLHRGKDAQAAVAGIGPAEVREEPLVQLVYLLADAAVVRYSGQRTEAELLSLEQRMRGYMTSNPDEVLGVTLLADLLSQMGRHHAAIEGYEAVLADKGKSAKSAGVMRNLTLNYVAVGRYLDAARMSAPAVTHDGSLKSDIYFMCAVSKAFASLDKIKTAKDVLNLLANKRPDVLDQPDFIAAVNFVREKMQAANNEAARPEG